MSRKRKNEAEEEEEEETEESYEEEEDTKTRSLHNICCALLSLPLCIGQTYSMRDVCIMVTQTYGVNATISERRLYDVYVFLEALGILKRDKQRYVIWQGIKNMTPYLLNDLPNLPRFTSHRSVRTVNANWMYRTILFFYKQEKPDVYIEVGDIVKGLGIVERNRRIRRRIYDILNILSAVGLIDKTALSKVKFGYRWRMRQPEESTTDCIPTFLSIPVIDIQDVPNLDMKEEDENMIDRFFSSLQ